MSLRRASLVFLSVLFPCAASLAQDNLQRTLDDTGVGRHWIYDDFERARALARQTGKPLLVLFRCVPCQCAEQLDEQVARQGSPLEELEQQFVCVRLVQMKGVDLHLFQFDRDLSFAVLLMNADGTVYGRYGTRARISRTENSHISLASFEKALQRALELHRQYPANQNQLAGKRASGGEYRRADEMPHLRQHLSGPTTVQNCIHCHMAGEGEVGRKLELGKLTAGDIFVYPLPENLGLRMDVDHGLLVKTVTPGSPAAQAGVQPGDEIVTLQGQPLVSQADIQWVLHHLPWEGTLDLTLRRGGQTLEKRLALDAGWKMTDVTWRESLWSIRPGMQLRNVVGQSQGITPGSLALLVRYPRGEAAKAGLRGGDIIVAVNGKTEWMTEGDFLSLVRLEDPPEQVALTILRRGQRQNVVLKLR
jgi:hypothetical protein